MWRLVPGPRAVLPPPGRPRRAGSQRRRSLAYLRSGSGGGGQGSCQKPPVSPACVSRRWAAAAVRGDQSGSSRSPYHDWASRHMVTDGMTSADRARRGPRPVLDVRAVAEQPDVRARRDHVVPPAAGRDRQMDDEVLAGRRGRAGPLLQGPAAAWAPGADHDRLAQRGADAEGIPGAPAPPQAVPRVARGRRAVGADHEAHRRSRERVRHPHRVARGRQHDRVGVVQVRSAAHTAASARPVSPASSATDGGRPGGRTCGRWPGARPGAGPSGPAHDRAAEARRAAPPDGHAARSAGGGPVGDQRGLDDGTVEDEGQVGGEFLGIGQPGPGGQRGQRPGHLLLVPPGDGRRAVVGLGTGQRGVDERATTEGSLPAADSTRSNTARMRPTGSPLSSSPRTPSPPGRITAAGSPVFRRGRRASAHAAGVPVEGRRQQVFLAREVTVRRHLPGPAAAAAASIDTERGPDRSQQSLGRRHQPFSRVMCPVTFQTIHGSIVPGNRTSGLSAWRRASPAAGRSLR